MSVVFNLGDKVRLTRGEEVLVGEVVELPGGLVIRAFIGDEWPDTLERMGWSISVVPSTPTLPEADRENETYQLDVDGNVWRLVWTSEGDQWWNVDEWYTPAEVVVHGPFTRLGSRESWRASWANEISDWLDGQYDPETANAIRAQFGGAVVDE